jgi:enamine deaminase RidA (YjgF/YER057c/UK114 family)
MRVPITTSAAPRSPRGFAQAARGGPFIFTSGLTASDHRTGLVPEARVTPGLPHYTLPMDVQTLALLGHAEKVIAAAGGRIEDSVSVTTFLTQGDQTSYAREGRVRFLKGASASTAVIVGGLPVKDAVTAVDLVTLAGDTPFGREIVNTDRAPVVPNNRYPQAVKTGPYIFTAGQIPTDFTHSVAKVAQIDPAFPLFGRAIKRQAAYILDNIGAVLEAAGSSLAHIVKATVFMPESADFQGLDEVWRQYFPVDPPARLVAPAATLFPDARLEIHTIAITKDGPLRKEVVRTTRAPIPTIHQSQAIKAGDLVFLSGLLATDFEQPVAPAAQVIPGLPHHSLAARREADFIFEAADAIIAEAGGSIADLVRWQAYVPALRDACHVEETLLARAGTGIPSGAVVQPIGPLILPDCSLLFDATAAVGGQ